MLQTGEGGVSGHECVAGRRHHLTAKERGRGREKEQRGRERERGR